MKKGFLKKLFSAIFKGAIKSVPFGGVAIEVLDTFVKSNENEKDPLILKVQKWAQIVTQVILLVCIFYSFFTKQLTIDELIKLVNGEQVADTTRGVIY